MKKCDKEQFLYVYETLVGVVFDAEIAGFYIRNTSIIGFNEFMCENASLPRLAAVDCTKKKSVYFNVENWTLMFVLLYAASQCSKITLLFMYFNRIKDFTRFILLWQFHRSVVLAGVFFSLRSWHSTCGTKGIRQTMLSMHWTWTRSWTSFYLITFIQIYELSSRGR